MTAPETSGFFDSYAHDFDAIYGGRRTPINRLIDRLFRRSMRLRYRKTLLGCAPFKDKSALDIGCGPGHYCLALARLGMNDVRGIDFAPAMIDLANQKASASNIEDSCRFIVGDFLSYDFDRSFDYCILMGLMDYIADPAVVISKALSLTTSRAFFSFPASSGILARQRRWRYRRRCDLYMYRRDEIEKLFDGTPCIRIEIEKISRDYFVTAHME